MFTKPKRSHRILPIALLIAILSPTQAVLANGTAGRQAKDFAAMVAAYANMLKARADLIRAHADAERQRVESDRMEAETRQLKLDNELRAARLFYAKRKLNRDYRVSRAQPRPSTRGGYGRSPSVNHGNEIAWPELMRRPQFKKQRAALQQLVEQSMRGERKASDRQVQRWLFVLRRQIRSVSTPETADQYLAALRTLRDVEWLILHAPEYASNAALANAS